MSFELREAIADMATKLQEGHPQLPILLRKIHTILRDDPDTVTILSDEERAVVIAGLEKQTQIKLAEIAAPKKTKSLRSMTVDDI